MTLYHIIQALSHTHSHTHTRRINMSIRRHLDAHTHHTQGICKHSHVVRSYTTLIDLLAVDLRSLLAYSMMTHPLPIAGKTLVARQLRTNKHTYTHLQPLGHICTMYIIIWLFHINSAYTQVLVWSILRPLLRPFRLRGKACIHVTTWS